MATDFLHTGDVVEAVLAVLRGADGATHTGGLPANWFHDAQDGTEIPLGGPGGADMLQHGDLADYASTDEVLADIPAILVRGLGTVMGERNLACYHTIEPVRIIHIRGFDDCRDSAGDLERNQARAREHYAKAIHAALFHDPHKRLAVIDSEGERTEVSLTCIDTSGASIYDCQLRGWDLGYDAGSSYSMQDVAAWRRLGNTRAWAIGCEIEVRVKSGP